MSDMSSEKELIQYLEKRKARLLILTENVQLNVQNRTQKHRIIQRTLKEVEENFNVEIKRITPSVYVIEQRIAISKLLKIAVQLITRLPNVKLFLYRKVTKQKPRFISEKGKSEPVKSARLLVIWYNAGKNLSQNKVKRKTEIEKIFRQLEKKGYEFVNIQSGVKVTKNKHSIYRLVKLARRLQKQIEGIQCFIVTKIPARWLSIFMGEKEIEEVVEQVVERKINVELSEEDIKIAQALLKMLREEKSWRKAIAKRINGLGLSTVEALERLLKKVTQFQ